MKAHSPLQIVFALCLAYLPQSAVSAQEVFDRTASIEQFAKFPGGTDKFYQYVQSNLRFPSDAQRDSLSGVVYVEFVLDKAGKIDRESIKVVQSLSPACDKEAIRLITSAPDWLPARSKSGAAGQSIIFPVSFEWKPD